MARTRGALVAVVVLATVALVASFAPVEATGRGHVHGSGAADARDALARWGGSVTVHDKTGKDRCGKVVLKPNGSHWRCSFVDNFRGTALNRDKWLAQDTDATGFHTGLTCFKDDDSTIVLRKGTVRLVVRKTRREFQCGVSSHRFATRYTGGMIGTRTKFSQTYGRWEVRVKFPTAKRATGLHGGYWMYPLDQTYGPWPASGEIDVAEWWSKFPRRIIPSLHYNARNRRLDSGRHCLVRTPTKFHRYGLVWTPNVMRFSIDGRVCFKRGWTPNLPQRAPQPFDHPFSFILHLGVGRHTGPHKVTDQTKIPAAFVVDYAKAWR